MARLRTKFISHRNQQRRFTSLGSMKAFLVLISFLAMGLCDEYSYQHKDYEAAPQPYKEAPVHYQGRQFTYGYVVNDDYAGTNFGAKEERNDYGTSGKYYVLLPDGRTQTVTYNVDDYSGYVADVQYSGYAQKPYAHEASYDSTPYH